MNTRNFSFEFNGNGREWDKSNGKSIMRWLTISYLSKKENYFYFQLFQHTNRCTAGAQQSISCIQIEFEKKNTENTRLWIIINLMVTKIHRLSIYHEWKSKAKQSKVRKKRNWKLCLALLVWDFVLFFSSLLFKTEINENSNLTMLLDTWKSIFICFVWFLKYFFFVWKM